MDAVLSREMWRKYALRLKALANALDLRADPSRTADIASVLRIPGTRNYKYSEPRPVELAHASAEPIEQEQLLDAIDLAHRTQRNEPEISHAGAPIGNARQTPQGTPPNLERLSSALKFISPDCSEKDWKFRGIAPLARAAKDHPEVADALCDLARSWSNSELRGEPAKAWTTPGNSNGKTGEEVFDEVWRRFFSNERAVAVTNLGTIFHDAKAAGWKDPDVFQVVPSTPEVIDPESAALRFIQGKFALLNLDGKVWVLDRRNLDEVSLSGVAEPLVSSNHRDGTLLMTRELVAHHASIKPVDITRTFFTNPKTVCYKGVEFNPGDTTPGYLNLWISPILQSRTGRWDFIRGFLRDVICNADEVAYQYLIRYLAHALQKPEEKPGVIIILLGGQGTGKGTFGRILHRIWGPSYLQVHNINAVTGNFNASLERAFWVFMDEALFVGDRRSSDSLKSLVTEPLIYINQKHQPARQSRSFHRFVAVSNAEHFKHTEQDDRRDFVLRVSEDRKGDHRYWRALHAEIEGDGTAAMMHDLLALDLSDFNVRDKPQTQALLQQKLMSLKPIAQWWYELLAGDSEDGWPDFIPTTDIVEAVKKIAGSRAYKSVRPVDVIQAMAKLCPSARKHQKTDKYNRQRGLRLPSREVGRTEFEAWIGGKVDW